MLVKLKSKKYNSSILTAWFIRLSFVLSLALSVLAIVYAYQETSSRLAHELDEIINADSGLYYTVGKGMANGLIPYQDMYENKPPVIFLLAEISYRLTGGFYMMNILQFISYLIILIVPVLTVGVVLYKKKANVFISFIVVLACVPLSMYMTSYCEDRCRALQVENFGAACSLLSFFCLSLGLGRKKKIYSPTSILAGFFLGFGVMLKEPFAIVTIVGYLFFIKNKKDIFYRFIVPCVYGVITAFIILACARCTKAYFTIYLNNMLFSHIEIYGSPFERGLNIGKLFTNLYNYSPYLEYLMCLILGADLAFSLFKKYSAKAWQNIILKLLNFIKVAIFLYAASFSVGLGGQYFYHHFIFAYPFYWLIIIDLVSHISLSKADMRQEAVVKKRKTDLMEGFKEVGAVFTPEQGNRGLRASLLLSLVFCFAAGISATLGFNKRGTYVEPDDAAVIDGNKSTAAYVDEMLDVIGADTYLYMGFNNGRAYFGEYTKHLPIGPCFVQDPSNFKDEDNYFAKAFMNQISEANVIVFNAFKIGVLKTRVQTYMSEYFTTCEPTALSNADLDIPTTYASYKYYFRSSVYSV